MWITLPSGWTVNVPRSVQTFENILLSLLLAYAKYYPYLIIRGNSGANKTDAGVLCRHLGMGMSGRATYLPRDWSFVRADAYGVYCHGNETDAHDCHVTSHWQTLSQNVVH
jgi:hypothetical protein